MRVPLRCCLGAAAVHVLLGGCASSSYQAAQKADTAEAYRSYLQASPKDENAEEAELRLAELDFNEASRLHTPLAYRHFLDNHPHAPQAPAAKARLETLRFSAAQGQGTASAYREFLKDHPDGVHRDEAEKALAKAEARETAPEDPRSKDDRAYAAALVAGPAKLLAYLDGFPEGSHRDAARAALFRVKIEGLLVSGLLEQAREEVGRSPLSAALPDLSERLALAERVEQAVRSRQPGVQAALAPHYLRSLEELRKAILAPDPKDRWEAAEEMGFHVGVQTLDPLMQAFRTGRNPLIRQHALESLFRVFQALPPQVAEYEASTRLETLRVVAQSAELFASEALLLDVLGRSELAAREYQRAFEEQAPDPVILRRWVQLREGRKEAFSAAVAARRLALWAREQAQAADADAPGSLPGARNLCAATGAAHFALEAIARAEQVKTEFPGDLTEFQHLAEGAVRLSEAKLADAEVVLRTQRLGTHTCAEDGVARRMEEAQAERTKAIRALGLQRTASARLVLTAVSERDPAPELRLEARAALERLGPAERPRASRED